MRTMMMAATATLVLATGAAMTPRGAGAATSVSCSDSVWAQYNECLVEAPLEFCKKVCDAEFMIMMGYCNAKAYHS